MPNFRESIISPDHLDFQILSQIESSIFARIDKEEFLANAPRLFRTAIDNVIDTPRKSRTSIDDLEKTEKTHIGTEIEILVREFLEVPRGYKLDLLIDDYEVDIKHTMGKNWMIPIEAVGELVFLLAEDEANAVCFWGIMVARDEYLTKGKNRDAKRSISAVGMANVLWLFRDHPYPRNFWSTISEEDRIYVMGGSSGTQRMRRLFRRLTGVVIARHVVEAVGRQKDSLKRIRRNGGARDKLEQENIAILSGAYDQEIIKSLGLPDCGESDFISFAPTNEGDLDRLRKRGHLLNKNP